MKNYLVTLILLFGSGAVLAQQAAEPRLEERDASRCHVYIDFEYIWTVEIVEESPGQFVPILNIITFGEEENSLNPDQIHLYDRRGRTAQVSKLAIDTGVPGDPYISTVLKVLGSSFIGMDLVGEFEGFSEPTRIAIELGRDEFQLQAVDCLDFEGLAERIDQINFNSPNIREDFDVLKIKPIGKKVPRRQGRR